MECLPPLRTQLARITRRGIGMTLAACVYWLGLTAVSLWAGLQPRVLALFFLIATALVYPLGWLLNRLCGGDLFARGHALSGLVLVLAATQTLGWPLLGLLLLDASHLLAFALAAMLGVHFLLFGWLYRSPAYYAVGIGSVLVAALVQAKWPERAPLWIPLTMAACYALAAAAVWREVRAAEL